MESRPSTFGPEAVGCAVHNLAPGRLLAFDGTWHQVRLEAGSGVEGSTVELADATYTCRSTIPRLVVEPADPLGRFSRPPVTTTRSTPIQPPTCPTPRDDGSGRIVCLQCSNIGLTGALVACVCTTVYPVPLRSLFSPPPTDLRRKTCQELDMSRPGDREEATRRALFDCQICDGAGICPQPCPACSGTGWYHRCVPLEVTGPDGVLSTMFTPDDL
jgi:hypothetical protein